MNFFRTMLLLAAMTALFMGVGYLIGGTGGMLIAFLFAIGTNAFAYWNSDKMVLRMHNAEPVTPGERARAPRHGRRGWRSAPSCRCRRST